MRNTGLVFRMENEEAAGLPVADTEALGVEAEASQAVDAVESASGDVTEVETGIENAVEAQTELQDVEESMQAAVDSGEGANPREAAQYEARLERVASLLGTTVQEMGLTFRAEAFGSTSNRLSATAMRLEGVKEWGKKVWEALKKGWEWLKDAVSNFFAKLFKNSEAIEKRLKTLQNQVATMKTKNAKQKKSTVGYAAALFSIDGKSGKDEALKLLNNGLEYAGILKSVSGSLDPSNLSSGAIVNYTQKIADMFKPSGATLADASKLPKSAEKDAEGGIRLPRGRAVLIVPKTETVDGSEFKTKIVVVGDADEKKADDYAALDFEGMGNILSKALELVKIVKEAKKSESDFKATIDKNIKYCEENSRIKESENSRQKDDKAKDSAARVLACARIANGVAIAATKLASRELPSAMFDLCAGAGDMVAGNLSNYKEEDK